jgi:hypothetical protein
MDSDEHADGYLYGDGDKDGEQYGKLHGKLDGNQHLYVHADLYSDLYVDTDLHLYADPGGKHREEGLGIGGEFG